MMMMMMNYLFLLALDYARCDKFILFGLDCVSYPCHQAGNECLVMDVVMVILLSLSYKQCHNDK